MRTKLDEDLSPRLREPLEREAHEVVTVASQGWAGMLDPELWPKVVAERVFFITADKGFGDVRRYVPGTHSGILLLRPARERRSEFLALLERVLASHRLEDHVGCLIVATSGRIRVRRPSENRGGSR